MLNGWQTFSPVILMNLPDIEFCEVGQRVMLPLCCIPTNLFEPSRVIFQRKPEKIQRNDMK